MKFSKNLNKERGLKPLAKPEDDAEGVGQQQRQADVKGEALLKS